MGTPSSSSDDRVVPYCPEIAYLPIQTVNLFPNGIDGDVDVSLLLEHLKREGRLHKADLLLITKRVTELMAHEPNVIRLDDPVTVVGDLHGQFYDLVQILSLTGASPPDRSFLFLGDYVDRGSFSVEILTYLYAWKLAFPKHVFLLRGNHESRDMSQFFNFRDECLYKYDVEVYDAFIKSFYALPLAAIVNNDYLCLHGGISPDLHNISQIYTIDRFSEPPGDGIFCDILWADPDNQESWLSGSRSGFRANEARGCSYYFSYEAVCDFLRENGLKCLIRAHEVQIDGFKMVANFQSLPAVITVFSAPNYCDQYGNKGAVLHIVDGALDVIQFEAHKHPFTLPNFMNVFDWSVPFVAEKVTEILHAMLNKEPESGACTEVSGTPRVKSANSAELVKLLQGEPPQATHRLRTKIKSVARLLAVMRSVREKRESQVQDASKQDAEETVNNIRFSEVSEADFLTEKRRPSTT